MERIWDVKQTGKPCSKDYFTQGSRPDRCSQNTVNNNSVSLRSRNFCLRLRNERLMICYLKEQKEGEKKRRHKPAISKCL